VTHSLFVALEAALVLAAGKYAAMGQEYLSLYEEGNAWPACWVGLPDAGAAQVPRPAALERKSWPSLREAHARRVQKQHVIPARLPRFDPASLFPRLLMSDAS
jgi:hypothetical protein